jgi:hypothetical protein
MHLWFPEIRAVEVSMRPADNDGQPLKQFSAGFSTAIPIEPFINAKQASELLHLSAKTLLRFARQGSFRPIH